MLARLEEPTRGVVILVILDFRVISSNSADSFTLLGKWVKSPHCQDHMYLTWATTYINVDAHGATSANLKSLGHTICKRPVFPLDDGVQFTPEAVIYRR